MRIRTVSLVLVALVSFAELQPASAVTYEYVGEPLSSYFGSTLAGHPIIFEFSTYNLLPPNLTFDRTTDVLPAHNVPVINWSVSIGPYQATGIGNPAGGDVTVGPGGAFQAGPPNDFYFLQFGTSPTGTITNWFFFANPVTTDQKNLLAVAIGTGGYESIAGPYDDYVQVNPNLVGTSYTELGITTSPGTWTLLDATAISSVPEPSTWAMMLIGFAVIGFAGYRRSLRPAHQ